MDTGKRQQLQDIYANEPRQRDDFTPQIAEEVVAQRQRDLRRHHFTNFVLGSVILLLSVSLVYVVVREYLDIQSQAPSPTPITQEYIPRYSLPAEKQWVMDFSREYADPTWTGKGERPFDSTWVKKAAYNIIMAEQAAGIGEYKDAAEYYENALQILPKVEGVKVPLGMIYFKLGENDKALALLENAPEADLTYDVLNNLGAACIGAKAYDKAEVYLKQSLQIKPTYAEALKNLAVLYAEQKRDNEAVDCYEKYLDQRPTDTDTRYNFALYLTKIGRWDLAADNLNLLAKDITNDTTLYFLLARVENKLNHPAEALAALRRGTQLTDPNLALAWMDESEFDQLRNTDEFQQMIKSLQKAKK